MPEGHHATAVAEVTRPESRSLAESETILAHAALVEVLVEIQLGPRGLLWSYDAGKGPVSNLVIDVPAGKTTIQLTLDATTVAAGYSYVSNPINWFSMNEQPIETPSVMTVERLDAEQTNITDFNPGMDTTAYGFRVTVNRGSRVFTSPDPTIINHKID